METISQLDYIKANRKGSRDAEIEMYGHSINYGRIFISKKVYSRKNKTWKNQHEMVD